MGFLLFGLGLYVAGKGLESIHRQKVLSASFTHLEETLRGDSELDQIEREVVEEEIRKAKE